jgi:predicted PurR-regulated permease PerM
MNRFFNLIVTLIGIAVIVFLVWRFSAIVSFILISAILSFIGQPLVKLVDRIRIGWFRMPHVLSTIITLLIIVTVIVGFFSIFIPLVVRQLNVIANIDINQLHEALKGPITKVQDFLIRYWIMPKDETIEDLVTKQFITFFNLSTFSNLFSNILSLTGTIFIGIFSVLFMTFFFLKDDHLFYDAIMLFTPSRYKEQTSNTISSIRELLSRYFIGLSVEMICLITMISLTLTILGVENAFLIGFFGGLINVIPYLGPFIGGTLGILIGITTSVNMGEYSNLLPLALKILGTFVVIKTIDDTVLQPWIYSRSVRAHPLEIFVVILIAGSIAGIIGMLLAIPTYTVARIIAKQFLSKFELVQNLTKRL